MKLSTIRESAWGQLRQEHPQAYAFLLRESLRGEWAHLQNRDHKTMSRWEKTRHEELDVLIKAEIL